MKERWWLKKLYFVCPFLRISKRVLKIIEKRLSVLACKRSFIKVPWCQNVRRRKRRSKILSFSSPHEHGMTNWLPKNIPKKAELEHRFPELIC